MSLYCGIDLHSNNHLVVIIDSKDNRLVEEKLSNNIELTLKLLKPFRHRVKDIAIESTFNWYWLVDGLQNAGYPVSLVNTAKIKQYEGLKHSDDKHDAFWLAHLSRLNILPTGFIYPKEFRGLRDLMRRRAQLVRLCSQQILSIQNQIWRSTGHKVTSTQLRQKKLTFEFTDTYVVASVKANYQMMQCAMTEVRRIEKDVESTLKSLNKFPHLQTIPGVGKILSMTIALETWDINRFSRVNDYASYCRCVNSVRLSNDKKKSEGNRKNGNKYLSWAFHEAAHHAVRYNAPIKKFFERKREKTNGIVAIRAVAHKLARAAFWVMKNNEPFSMQRAFG